jgi:hypothetical protein
MTSLITATTHRTTGTHNRPSSKRTDEAPMVITRLSGWIDVGELKSATPAWIVPTRLNAPAR